MDKREKILKLAKKSDCTIVSIFIRVSAFKGSIDLSEEQISLLNKIFKYKKPTIVTVYGSPYLLSFIPKTPTYILTYDYRGETMTATIKAIFGNAIFKGKLPISMPDMYPIGYGIETKIKK